MVDLVVVLACRNRREKTVLAVSETIRQVRAAGMSARIVAVDDASSDGTPEALAALDDCVTVLPGSGELYWGWAMWLGMQYAAAEELVAPVLWLNDDVELFDGAVGGAVATLHGKAQGDAPAIVIGPCRNARGETSYSGYQFSRGKLRMKLSRVDPSGDLFQVDSMNGNFVLISTTAIKRVGNLDPAFRHTLGDLDFGLRAKASGCALFLMPDYVGVCERNPVRNTFEDESLRPLVRLRRLTELKGLPPRQWARFLRRHGGAFWVLQWMGTYWNVFRKRE